MTTYGRPYPPGALTTQQAAEVLGVTVDLPYFGRDAGLAREFGVSQTTIRKIFAGRAWRHVA